MKQNQVIHTIVWNDYAKSTYLYGSTVNVTNPYNVYFKNDLIPSGSVIKEWQSKTSYFRDRACPTCPTIETDVPYYISFDCESHPVQKVFVRINFYDQTDQLIDSYMQKEKHGQFIAPSKTFWYDIQLIQAGAKELLFHSIQFSKEPLKQDILQPSNSGKLNLIFVEPVGNAMILPNMKPLALLDNVYFVCQPYPNQNDIAPLRRKWKEIRCIGYGDTSNQNAVRLAKQMHVNAYTSKAVTGKFEYVYAKEQPNNLFQSIIDSSSVLNQYVDNYMGVHYE